MTLIPNTFIPVWQVELMFRQGLGDAQILARFPSLTKADLIACHQYVTAHMEEVGREIEENSLASDPAEDRICQPQVGSSNTA